MIDFESYKVLSNYVKQGRLDLIKYYIGGAKDDYYRFESKRTMEDLLRELSGDNNTYEYVPGEEVDGRRLVKLLICTQYFAIMTDNYSILPDNPSKFDLKEIYIKEPDKYQSRAFTAFGKYEPLCTSSIIRTYKPTEKNPNLMKFKIKESDKLLKFDKRLVDGVKLILNPEEFIDQKIGFIRDDAPALFITGKRGKALVMGIKNNVNNQ